VKLTEHEMLLTLAMMALEMDDLTWHDIFEALREFGYGDVVREARKTTKKRGRLGVRRQTGSSLNSIPIKSGGGIELCVRRDGVIDLYAGRVLGPPIHRDVVQPTREELKTLRNIIDKIEDSEGARLSVPAPEKLEIPADVTLVLNSDDKPEFEP
jgi:hypothetical protein